MRALPNIVPVIYHPNFEVDDRYHANLRCSRFQRTPNAYRVNTEHKVEARAYRPCGKCWRESGYSVTPEIAYAMALA